MQYVPVYARRGILLTVFLVIGSMLPLTGRSMPPQHLRGGLALNPLMVGPWSISTIPQFRKEVSQQDRPVCHGEYHQVPCQL